MYLSAPAFTPNNTELLEAYQKDFGNSVTILHHGGGTQHWQACLQTIEGHTGAVSAVAFSPASGCYIASASDDFTVKIWDAVSGAHQKTLKGHTRKVNCLIWSYDDVFIMTASDDATIKQWHALTGELVRSCGMRADSLAVFCLCLCSPQVASLLSVAVSGSECIQLFKCQHPEQYLSESWHMAYSFGELATSVSASPDSMNSLPLDQRVD